MLLGELRLLPGLSGLMPSTTVSPNVAWDFVKDHACFRMQPGVSAFRSPSTRAPCGDGRGQLDGLLVLVEEREVESVWG